MGPPPRSVPDRVTPVPGGGRRSGPPPRYPVGAQAALERRRALEQGRRPRGRCPASAARWPASPTPGAIPPAVVPTPGAIPVQPWSRHRGRYPAAPRAADTGGYPRAATPTPAATPALRDPDPSGYPPRREADLTASGDRGGAVAPSRRRWPGGDGYGGDAYGDDTYGDDYDDYDDAELDELPKRRGCRRAVAVLAVLVVLAMVAGWFGWSWVQGKIDPSGPPGETVLVDDPRGHQHRGGRRRAGRRRRDQRRHGLGLVHEAARRRHHQGRQLRDAARLVVRRGDRRPEGRAAAARGRGVRHGASGADPGPDRRPPGRPRGRARPASRPRRCRRRWPTPRPRSALPARPTSPRSRARSTPRRTPSRRATRRRRSCSGWCRSSTRWRPSSTSTGGPQRSACSPYEVAHRGVDDRARGRHRRPTARASPGSSTTAWPRASRSASTPPAATRRARSPASSRPPSSRTTRPYDTRAQPGLPPTPIASPGAGQPVEAALNPAEGDWRWYVLDVEADDGSSFFTNDYDGVPGRQGTVRRGRASVADRAVPPVTGATRVAGGHRIAGPPLAVADAAERRVPRHRARLGVRRVRGPRGAGGGAPWRPCARWASAACR